MYKLKLSSRKDKKYMLIDPENKKIHFGSPKHENYTIHGDDKRKSAYITRHKKREKWDQINPGSLSRYVLWEYKSLNKAI